MEGKYFNCVDNFHTMNQDQITLLKKLDLIFVKISESIDVVHRH